MDKDLLHIFETKKGKKYDVAVMYSGGKDSSYLLYLLKEVYKMRVIAVMVDNGYENQCLWEPMKAFAEQMNVPLVILKPEQKYFRTLFRMLVLDHEIFHRDGVNHICFICNNILWCSVAQYAYEQGIPYVASGLSIAQLSSGRKIPLKPDVMANAIAERSTRMIYKNALSDMENTEIYKNDVKFRGFMKNFNEAIKSIITVYPYIYHSISVDEQIKCLKELGWNPPNGVSVNQYISSGCRIMRGLVYELEKLGIVKLNEREQVKMMIEKGLMNAGQWSYANEDVSKEMVNIGTEEIKMLGLEEYLEKICIDSGKTYIK